ncbi:6-bladed beta-propeller [Acanthopleuribacter pedis]|uniref:6-bladed beta-propeller n=1 Tax=Acanthopleuribacter pedis TaxID=442870 RepID=A0A8J7U8J2_9BACT|nr:6-bladed beta-propeller [Acanthopleuribacter pedis]MBO1322611.1 6-bladed beta-propeller [Acanthopleuribacter pedis]
MKFFLLVILACVVSCQSNSPPQLSSESTPSYEKLHFQHLDAQTLEDIFNIQKAIKLETHEHALIGRINKVKIAEKTRNIVVGDYYSSSAIFIFDKDGAFIRRVGQKGPGPGEYRQLTDFSINEKEELFLLADRTVLKYSPTGKFIGKKSLTFAPIEIFSHLGLQYIRVGIGKPDTKSPSFLIYDNDLRNIGSIGSLDLRQNKYLTTSSPTIAAYEDSLYFTDLYAPSLNKYKKSQLRTWKFGEENPAFLAAWNEEPFNEGSRKEIRDNLWNFPLIHTFDGSLLFFEASRGADFSVDRYRMIHLDTLKAVTFKGSILRDTDPANKNSPSIRRIVGHSPKSLIGVINDPMRFSDFKSSNPCFKDILFTAKDNQILIFFNLKSDVYNKTSPTQI